MKLESKPTQFDRLRGILLPILTDASVGCFDNDVPIDAHDDKDLNELLAGVQVMLDVIRQQQVEIKKSTKLASDAQRKATEMLETVLDTTIR